jgi:hypothetical protein
MFKDPVIEDHKLFINWASGMAQVVEFLISKHEVLSSNFNTEKKGF